VCLLLLIELQPLQLLLQLIPDSYAGHAMVDSQGIQYLVCKDFERMEGNRDAALDQYGIKVATVLNYVTKASRAVLIIDACRNKEISVGDPGVHCLENLAGAIVVYSCAYGSVAMNGANGGCYAEHVLKVRGLSIKQ